jgi:hypothetical protein
LRWKKVQRKKMYAKVSVGKETNSRSVGGLSSDQASEGGDAEGEDGTHVDVWGGDC